MKLLTFINSLDQVFGNDMVGWLWLRVSHEAAVKMPSRMQSPEDKSGTGGLTAEMAIGRKPLCLATQMLC